MPLRSVRVGLHVTKERDIYITTYYSDHERIADK